MKLVVPLLVVLMAPAAAAAQPSPSPATLLREFSLDQLGSIEVTTVSKQPVEAWRSAAAVFVLTQDDIRRSGATTLPELLRLVAGVQVSRLDSSHWAVGVRGLTSAFSKSLLVLIDGRSIYTPLFSGVFWQVQDTLIEDIERIEVIRGPGGTIWGANAVNGVINVITRSSRETVGALASVSGGNVDQGRVGFRYGGSRGDALHYRVYGSGFVRAAQRHTDGHLFDDWSIGQAGFRMDATRPGGDTFSVQGDLYSGTAGDRLGVGSFFPPSRLMVEGAERVSGGNLLARWQRDIQGGGGVQFQAYYDRTTRAGLHFGESRHTFDVDFLHRTPLGRRHDVSWGAGARFSPADYTTVYSTLSFVPEDRAHRFVSAFAHDEIAVVGDRLWLTLGSKLEHNSDSGLEVQPSARLLWRPNARETVWTSVTRALRTPSRIDTDLRLTGFGSVDPPAYLLVTGSRDFRSESLVGVEVGYRRLLASQLYLDVTAFHNNYDDLAGFGPFAITVERDPILHLQFAVPYENAIRGTIDGFEMSPDWRPASWLRLKGAYAFLTIDMENRPGYLADDPNILLYEESSPRHQGFVQASLTLPGRLELDHIYRFVGRLPSHDIPGYVTADARLGWQLSNQVTVAIAGHNLLQPHHVEFFRDDVAPVGIRRSVYATLTWRR
ncbi:MAG: TonB-dependent receptor plug domain-containing protein [Luteitalea sp.]|nr:TonB-dependent receptor plug domain-containing protein [Luteitalea sp.]